MQAAVRTGRILTLPEPCFAAWPTTPWASTRTGRSTTAPRAISSARHSRISLQHATTQDHDLRLEY